MRRALDQYVHVLSYSLPEVGFFGADVRISCSSKVGLQFRLVDLCDGSYTQWFLLEFVEYVFKRAPAERMDYCLLGMSKRMGGSVGV